MDQGRKRRDQMDAAAMPLVRRQRRPPSASCAGLQSRQFPAHASNAGADQRRVAGEPEGKADQDRREDREPRPLCRFSDGRDRHSAKFVRRDFASDRRIAATSSTVNCVRPCMSPFRAEPMGGLRPNDGKTSACAARCCSGGQRPPKTVPSQHAASGPAGSRNHLCRFGVHLTDSG
jgi:hypothetical protein